MKIFSFDESQYGFREMVAQLRRVYAPNKVVLLRPEGAEDEIASIAPFVQEQEMLDGKATAYVCVNRACSLPTADPQKMVDLIKHEKTE